ncbi:DegT/DnrJ/EryC1/StrS family aminotransferase [Propionivibrio sp.]|uniref:DegT/DnrJ/EryC1/StrS family aminotransferase n=1 Tax=Propionivibrio sp. TaxID=2212460 RepID=UPI0025CBF9BF|nr:DegT/DnrJ/EryC1/StrS family aminotransferase [Propionivibrio sp.]MBK7357394.1 DegT/DnrJ/EryC1/StrS family aminotransferase [Propionivibrio sp.]MBK8743241.1 DegT/DnrJ/EryC1/StrS family aminotransferase [Propionivibrio sp.]MBK8894744.1 DegT/DnrJ/EryC1/StrS family aminotransferase [Propionivibrio sp.]
MINVTKTFLPPLEEYVSYLERIWASGQITNNGELLRELEQRLKDFLGVKHLFFTANGTLALQVALRAMDIKGQVITTPFSYVATTGALLWEHCEPVFVDIGPRDYCIDPGKIEAAITPETEAILAVHVYGCACEVDAIAAIARRHNLKVLYDAAHTFGARLNGRSLASYGDAAALSFHATKLFHTGEGGAVVTDNDDLARKIRLYRAFGHIGEDYFSIGINAKNSELHAAMGLCMLPRVPELIAMRRELASGYDQQLHELPLVRPQPAEGLERNFAYYPVVFPSEAALLSARAALAAANIGTRRYFFPPLNRLPYVQGDSCPLAEAVSARVLCLPLSHAITSSMQREITDMLRACLLS